MKSAKPAQAQGLPPDLTFEKAMHDLDAIVRQLESGQGSLEEAITAYERGAQLRTFCEQTLKAAELRIEQITHNNGQITAAPFTGAVNE
jgi:exodeoxyribonuclease VII small subunit